VGVQFGFSGVVWEWRGPAPFHFVSVPAEDAEEIKDAASRVSYGWGMIPVSATIGATSFTTSLWPKNGSYVLPLKDAVRNAEGIELDDVIDVSFVLAPRRGR
jgi:hypothetical protein